MVKFKEKKDPGYKTISRHLKIMAVDSEAVSKPESRRNLSPL